MPSRFYIRPHESNLGPQLMNMGVQLYGLKQRGELAREQMALSEKELGMKGQQLSEEQRINALKYGTPGTESDAWNVGAPATPGLEQQKIGIAGKEAILGERRQDLLEKETTRKAEEEGKANVDLANFEPIKAARTVKQLEALGLPKNHALSKRIIEMAMDKNITNADAYDELKSLYPQFRKEIIEKVTDSYIKADEASPLYHKSPEGQAQQQLIDMLSKDDTGDTILGKVFQGTIEARQKRQAPAMTAQANLVKSLQPEKMSTDQLMAQKVINGEMTLEEAFKMKKEQAEKPPSNVYQDFATGYKAELKAAHPDWTDEQINLATADEANKRKLTGQIQVSVAGSEARGRAFANERFYTMFDTATGKTVKVKGLELNDDTKNRYLDPQDPNLMADKGSLVKITKGMDSVNAFEKGAANALDYAESVAKDFKLGKYPLANRASQLFQYHVGDPKVKGLRNAITTAATEYMKVINAGSDLTAAELSVMGQQRAKEIIEAADNFESLKNSMQIMKREMQISGDKFKAQRREVQGRLKGYGGEATPETGGVEEEKTIGGKTYIKQNGKWFEK